MHKLLQHIDLDSPASFSNLFDPVPVAYIYEKVLLEISAEDDGKIDAEPNKN